MQSHGCRAIWRFFLMRGVVIAVPCNALNALTGIFRSIGHLVQGSPQPWHNCILFALGISMVIHPKPYTLNPKL